MTQEVTLFNDTIENNIIYGGHSNQEITDAVKASHIDEFIHDLPDGLQTKVGDQGILLSGGQRQTIAISRLLLQKVKLVILDEPMAALGVEEGRHVLKLIEKMKSNNISIIVISHNLEHVFKLADRIAIMKNGEMINILNTSTTNRESVVKLITFGQT